MYMGARGKTAPRKGTIAYFVLYSIAIGRLEGVPYTCPPRNAPIYHIIAAITKEGRIISRYFFLWFSWFLVLYTKINTNPIIPHARERL